MNKMMWAVAAVALGLLAGMNFMKAPAEAASAVGTMNMTPFTQLQAPSTTNVDYYLGGNRYCRTRYRCCKRYNYGYCVKYGYCYKNCYHKKKRYNYNGSY